MRYLRENKIDWRLCSGYWYYDRNYPSGEEFDRDKIGYVPLDFSPLDELHLNFSDSLLIVSHDTLSYWIKSDSAYTTFVYEIFRPKEDGLDELHLNRIDPNDEPMQTLVYVSKQFY